MPLSIHDKEKLAAVKRTLGRRKYRMLWLRKVEELTQQEIAGRMRISQQMVSKDLKVIERLIGERREEERARRRATPGYFPALSLN